MANSHELHRRKKVKIFSNAQILFIFFYWILLSFRPSFINLKDLYMNPIKKKGYIDEENRKLFRNELKPVIAQWLNDPRNQFTGRKLVGNDKNEKEESSLIIMVHATHGPLQMDPIRDNTPKTCKKFISWSFPPSLSHSEFLEACCVFPNRNVLAC